MIREASGRDLRTAIVSLPPALRTAVWMRDIEGLSYAEIARRLEIPVGTVMSRLSSARERVYRRLTGNTKFGGRLRR
jgi:RNA polymerase sigma-70 factor (ECF subfamily)